MKKPLLSVRERNQRPRAGKQTGVKNRRKGPHEIALDATEFLVFCVGCDTFHFGSPLRILLGNPGLPGFPRGRVLTGEGDRGNLVNSECVRAVSTVGREHLKIGSEP